LDHVQRPAPAPVVEAAARRLAVDGDHLAAPDPHGPDLLGEGGDEAPEARLEGVGVEQAKHPREGVVAGNSAGKPQKPAQKRLLGAPKHRHVDAGLAATQGRRQGDQHNLQQIVSLGIAGARVDQIPKARPKPLHAAILLQNQGGST